MPRGHHGGGHHGGSRHHGHHHHGHHRRGPGLGAVVAGAAIGAGVGLAVTHRRPARVHHRYRQQVVIVSAPSASERMVRLVCPPGMAEGMVMEIAVEGVPYFVTIPRGLSSGMQFDAAIPLAVPPQPAVVLPPKFLPRCVIVSDLSLIHI